MFLIAVAILTLTWFLLTATKLVSDCYRKAWKEVDEVGYESPFFQDDTDFCYKLIQVSQVLCCAKGDSCAVLPCAVLVCQNK